MDLFVNATPVTDPDLALAANLLPALRGCKAAFDHEMPGKCLAGYCAVHGLARIPGTSMYYPQVRVTLILPTGASHSLTCEAPTRPFKAPFVTRITTTTTLLPSTLRAVHTRTLHSPALTRSMPPHSPQMETQWALFLAGLGEAAHAAVVEGGGRGWGLRRWVNKHQ